MSKSLIEMSKDANRCMGSISALINKNPISDLALRGFDEAHRFLLDQYAKELDTKNPSSTAVRYCKKHGLKRELIGN